MMAAAARARHAAVRHVRAHAVRRACSPGFDALFPRNTLRAYWKSQYLDELTDEAIDTIAAHRATTAPRR